MAQQFAPSISSIRAVPAASGDDLGSYYFRTGQPSADYVELDATAADGTVTESSFKFIPLDIQ
jgi:hypothetical protein